MEKFHQEISSMKSVFKSNGYPKNFIDNKVILTVPKLQLVCMLPYTSKPSLDLRARLRCAIDRKYHSVNLILFLDPLAELVNCLDSNTSSRKDIRNITETSYKDL